MGYINIWETKIRRPRQVQQLLQDHLLRYLFFNTISYILMVQSMYREIHICLNWTLNKLKTFVIQTLNVITSIYMYNVSIFIKLNLSNPRQVSSKQNKVSRHMITHRMRQYLIIYPFFIFDNDNQSWSRMWDVTIPSKGSNFQVRNKAWQVSDEGKCEQQR